MNKLKSRFTNIPIERKRNFHGYVFILPWVIGVIAFFLVPIIQSAIYIFCDVTIESGGYTKTFTGLQNFKTVFLHDAENFRLIVESVGDVLFESFLIVVFSLMMAIFLNSKFPTKGFAKALYTLPIVFGSGILLTIFKQDLFMQSNVSGSDVSVFRSVMLENMLLNLGLGSELIDFIMGLVTKVLDIVWKSGIQIMLFTAALNSVSPQLYEVCKVEGATSWQIFWEVTFPMVTPFILLNSVYTIVDMSTYYSNRVMQKIEYYFGLVLYEQSITLSVIYSLFVLILVGIVALIMSKFVYNIEK